jgi:hypothetical protein
MRKLSTVATILSLVALFTLGGTALAGSCCGKGAISTSCGEEKSVGTACGSASSASIAEPSCQGEKLSSCKDDLMISSYINVKRGLHMSCSHSTNNAVSVWKSDVRKLIQTDESQENAVHLKNLVEVLDSWPSDIETQRNTFEKLSNWTIGYMEMFPERCQGAEIKSSGKSGQRWVETQDVAGDPYSS